MTRVFTGIVGFEQLGQFLVNAVAPCGHHILLDSIAEQGAGPRFCLVPHRVQAKRKAIRTRQRPLGEENGSKDRDEQVDKIHG
jgi:hypothetical protein